MKRDLLIRIGIKMILPFMLLFAAYVHLHGDYGPGGGFQAGVIIAGMVIVHALVFGIEAAKRIAPAALVEMLVPAGVMIYLSAGLPSLFVGLQYLDYSVYGADPLHAHEWGVFLVEAGVITTVSATMIAIFYAFTSRQPS
jgi:multicomponent Na+:H+ antiporter subunit B